MKLQGKAKEDFEKWYSDTVPNLTEWKYKENGEIESCPSLLRFKQLPDSMKYGVLVDWFDSVGIIVEIIVRKNNLGYISHFRPFINYDRRLRDTKDFVKRDEARTAAIEKATEIYNSTS